MADDKAPKVDYSVEFTYLVLGLFLLSVIIERVIALLREWRDGALGIFSDNLAERFFGPLWPLVLAWGWIVSILSIVLIIYNIRALGKLNREEQEIYGTLTGPLEKKAEVSQVEEKEENKEWKRVQEHINSQNPSDWRTAVLEADTMVERALSNKGYHGESLGEMLKTIEKGDLLSLEGIWEAHKTRNRIAHSTGEALPEREARRAIQLFELALKELKVI